MTDTQKHKIPEIDRENKNFITKVNSLSLGNLINNPKILFFTSCDGIIHDEIFGDFYLSGMDVFDYLIHRCYGITLSNRAMFYLQHNIVIELHYIMKDGNYKQVDFTPKPNGIWEEL